MASIIIRNLDEQLKSQLLIQAERHGHSMEEEVRIILRKALNQPQKVGLGSRIRDRFADAGGVELEVPQRSDRPNDSDFST